MTLPRKRQISLDQTRYYHCMSRCVRRAFLCGKDKFTGKNFEHRRQWIEERLKQLASIYAIEILAYAVMHNHYHVVLRVVVEKAASWSDDEVAKRWGQLFSVPEADIHDCELRRWRQRLASISWFMRCINEPIARRANSEDECNGRFWEGRFKLQALLDENAVLRCMTYVDLNPVRSGITRTPEEARHTSFRARVEGRDAHLVKLSGGDALGKGAISTSHQQYLNLVRWSARCIRSGESGRIPRSCKPLLRRMHLSSLQWTREIAHYGRWYHRAVGSLSSLEKYCAHLDQRWLKGIGRLRLCPA